MNRQQAQRRGLLDYYDLLVEKEPAPWNPGYVPRSSDVTPEECNGAGSLGDMASGGLTFHGIGDVPASFVPAMGHKFNNVMLCENCGCSWRFHQQDKTRCYVESGDAPKEDAETVRERIRKLQELYTTQKPRKTERKRTGKYPHQCTHCGDSFGSAHGRAQYCCLACGTAARKRAKD